MHMHLVAIQVAAAVMQHRHLLFLHLEERVPLILHQGMMGIHVWLKRLQQKRDLPAPLPLHLLTDLVVQMNTDEKMAQHEPKKLLPAQHPLS